MSDESWGQQVALTFGNTELTKAPKKPHELVKNSMGRKIYESLKRTLAESFGPSLARTIYDALSLKPGLFGISLDLKLLLEGMFPKLKDRLNDVRLDQSGFDRLHIFIEKDGIPAAISIVKAKRGLGGKFFNTLLKSSVIATFGNDGEDSVRGAPLIAQIIYAYR